MVDDETELAFSDALDSLLFAEQVPLDLLYRLSDLTEDEMLEFERKWPTVSDERRHEIIRHLVDISEDDFFVDYHPLFANCLADPNPAVRSIALYGLWDTTDLTMLEPIIDRLKNDPEAEVQAAAAGSLAHFLLMSAWGQLKGVRIDVIIEALLAAFYDPAARFIVRRAALVALGSVNLPEINKAIEDSYESSERELQLSALFAMGNSADSRWLPIILDEMESPYDEMRQEAVRAAGSIGDSQVIPHLAELAYDDSEDVAQAAIMALAEIGGDQVDEILLQMSEDPELEEQDQVIMEALEESSWSTLDLQFGLLLDEFLDEEE